MQSHKKILVSSILLTAILVGSGTYFLTEQTGSENTPSLKNSITFDKSSQEYAVMGRQTWSAFECYSLASEIGDQKEAERLFLFAYEQGKQFMGALSASKIEQKDLSEEVPFGLTMLLRGPSEEFILGRIHENAQENALKEVYNTNGEYNNDETQKIIASSKFRDGNCQLIGKSNLK